MIWENQTTVQGLLRHILHWKVLCCHFTWKQDGTSDGVTPDFPGVIVSGVDSSEGINSLGCIGLWAKISPHFTLEFLQKYFVKIIRIKSEKELTPEIRGRESRFFCTWVLKTRGAIQLEKNHHENHHESPIWFFIVTFWCEVFSWWFSWWFFFQLNCAPGF